MAVSIAEMEKTLKTVGEDLAEAWDWLAVTNRRIMGLSLNWKERLVQAVDAVDAYRAAVELAETHGVLKALIAETKAG